jgi:hypothetical protein
MDPEQRPTQSLQAGGREAIVVGEQDPHSAIV